LTLPVSALERRIRNLEGSDALLLGKIGDFQTKRQKSEEAAAKYKRHLEKLKKKKEALEVEKKDL